MYNMFGLRSLTKLLLVGSRGAASAARSLSYAAVGDSYASGDGAGSSKLLPHFDIGCGRFSQAYPVQIANSTGLNITNADFKNLACGGTTSVSVLYSQVSRIGDSDIVTVTVGGNEVDFFVVLNACIHQWWPLESCEKEMTKARTLVQSSNFLDNFNRMVAVTKRSMKSDGLLLVTGYSAFFNDKTEQCNNVSFSKRNPSNFLTRELRASFNQMLRMVNDVIRAATEAHGAVYVDLDSVFEEHRFCEEGVTEPAQSNGTWFFNVDLSGDDTGHSEALPNEHQYSLPGPVKDFFDLTRTFHPTGQGHAAIAEEIVRLVQLQSPTIAES